MIKKKVNLIGILEKASNDQLGTVWMKSYELTDSDINSIVVNKVFPLPLECPTKLGSKSANVQFIDSSHPGWMFLLPTADFTLLIS